MKIDKVKEEEKKAKQLEKKKKRLSNKGAGDGMDTAPLSSKSASDWTPEYKLSNMPSGSGAKWNIGNNSENNNSEKTQTTK